MAAINRPRPITIMVLMEWIALIGGILSFISNAAEESLWGIILFALFFLLLGISSIGLWLNLKWGGILNIVPLGIGTVWLFINGAFFPGAILLVFIALVIVNFHKMEDLPPRKKKVVEISAVWQCPDCKMHNFHTLICPGCGRVRDVN